MKPADVTFDASALGARYSVLDALPEGLYEPVVTYGRGDLLQRAAGVLALRGKLLEGALPSEISLPPREIASQLRERLSSLELPRFCRNEPTLTDAVLDDVLRVLADAASWRDDIFAEVATDLESKARARRIHVPRPTRRKRRAPGPRADISVEVPGLAGDEEPTSEELRRVWHEADAEANRRAGALAVAALDGAWKERVSLWVELEEVFGALGQLLGMGWDLSRGLLRSQGFLEASRLRALLEHLPAMRDLVRALGRMQSSTQKDATPVLEEVFGPMRRVVEEIRRVRSPLAPTETRGVERSGEIGRMLPSEAALLTHPLLRLLWHARRAERALLTYRAEGMVEEIVLEERDGTSATRKPRDAGEERGPMLLCVDTSGSMAGVPETVAKAVALEAVRVAHQERRRCIAYLFSGPGDVVEYELSLTPEGLGRLFAFLTTSFHGGTDVAAPFARALDRIEQEAWRKADVLLVSDGEFPVPRETALAVTRARSERGVRVHGLLIAASASGAMASLCEPLHTFLDWQALLRER